MNRETEIKQLTELVKRYGARSTIGLLREAVDSAAEEIPNALDRARIDMEKAAMVLIQAENRL